MIAKLKQNFLFRLLVVVPSIIGVAYFGLWACAPAAVLPAPMPMSGDYANEIGIAGNAALNIPIDDIDIPHGGSGALYYYRRLGKAGGLGATAFGGTPDMVGAGVMARINMHQNDRVLIALQPHAGWLWAGIGVPMSVKVAEGTWFNVTPNAHVGFNRRFELPIGISYESRGGLVVSAQLGGSYGISEEPNFEGFEGRVFASRATVVLSYRFGGPNAPKRP